MKYHYLIFIAFIFFSCNSHGQKNVANDEEAEYNKPVIDQLIKVGDKLDSPRTIQHWIYFANTTDRDNFMQLAKDNGYQIDDTTSLPDTVKPITT